ncbi:cytochrome P450 [Fennellomyces sp. T-0311]|nr:cytochrome P450 [Fennellomyces sp. T-0311]
MYVYMGAKPWLLIGDPYLAHELLSINGSATADRPFQLFTHEYFAQDRGINFCNPSSQWSTTRGAVLRLIGPKSILPIRAIVESEINEFIEGILSSGDNQIDILQPLELSVMNALLRITVGKRASTVEDPFFINIRAALHEGFTYSDIMKDMNTFFPIFPILDYLFHRPQMERFVRDKFIPMYDKLIKEALENDGNCIAKELHQLDYMDEMAVIVTITWNVVMLCCHVDVQNTLQKEIDTFITMFKRLPTFDDRDHFSHLISFQKECIRYRPFTITGLHHETTKDVSCRGYYIPKGTTIASNMRAMHMSPDIFDDPETFKPDRLIHHLKPMSALVNAAVQDRDLYIFGWGRRTCIGAHLAEMQMFTILVNLLAQCVIEPAIDQDQIPRLPNPDNLNDYASLVMPQGTVVRIRKRPITP